MAIAAATLVLPHTPVTAALGLEPVAPIFQLILGAIVACYIAAAEVAKWFLP